MAQASVWNVAPEIKVERKADKQLANIALIPTKGMSAFAIAEEINVRECCLSPGTPKT